MIISRSTHVDANGISSLSAHLSVDIWLLPCPGYGNSAATNIEVHVFFLKYDFSPDIRHGVGFLNDTVILDKVFLNPRVPQNHGF